MSRNTNAMTIAPNRLTKKKEVRENMCPIFEGNPEKVGWEYSYTVKRLDGNEMSRLELLQTLHLAIEAARFATFYGSTSWNISPGTMAIISMNWEPVAVLLPLYSLGGDLCRPHKNRRSSAASSSTE